MEDMALKTLFYGLEQCGIDDAGRTLFVNARAHARIGDDFMCVQWFKPYADGLSGHESLPRIEDVGGQFDSVFILIPKNMVESRYLVAKSLRLLKDGGMLYCACENKAGGTRLQKMVHANVQAIENAVNAGSLQDIEKIGFKSQAGVYGWDKIDKGSALLLQHVPQDLKGKIADFGCGYGYFLQHILQQNDGVKRAYAIDADARALECVRENMRDARAECLWADLTRGAGIPTRLDAIVMNPPFHEGKRTDSDIGVSFIKTAAASLRRNGALYMVANNQLPYETVLKDVFFSYECIAQENGFKVFKAVV